MLVASNPPKNKASRITTACNPCRSRKQKCNGDRPICKQCIDYNRTCAWPEQLKRGPAKGYVDALEQRLQETEDVLLSILSQLTHAQLSSMLSAQNSFSREGGAQHKRESQIPMLPSRKRGVEYWKSFPLSGVESIKKWQQDCHRAQSRLSPSQDDGDTIELVKPANRASTRIPANAHSKLEESQTNIEPPGDGPSFTTSESFQGRSAYLSHPTVNSEPETRALQSEVDCHGCGSRDTNTCLSLSSMEQGEPRILKEFSSWEAAPSIQFQRQFLW